MLSVSVAAEGRLRRPRIRVSLPLVVLVVAVLVFVWVALLGTRVVVLRSLEPTVTVQDWAVGGAAVMLILLGVLLATRGRAQVEVEGQALPPPPGEPAAYFPPDELVVTADSWQGLRVLEYSRPPKSESPSAVYAKCHIAVGQGLALRVEDRVAEARE